MSKTITGKSKSPTQGHTLAKDREAFKGELKTDAYRTLLDRLSSPVEKIVHGIGGGLISPRFWVSILILESLVLGLALGISALLRESSEVRIQILELFNVVISFCFIISVKYYFDKLKEGFHSDFIEYVNSEKSLKEIKTWFSKITNRTWPLVWGLGFSLVFSIGLAFFGRYILYEYEGGFLGWGPFVLLFLANFPIGTGGYYLWISRNFRVQAKVWDFKIYEPNPSKSIAVLKFSKLLSIPVTIIAFLATLTTLAFSVTRSFSLPVLMIAVICGWYPMLSIFVRNHIALAGIIMTAKQRKLLELQKKYAEFEREGMKSASGIEYLEKLMDYHDRIAVTPNSALNFRITFGFFNSLLLPLLTLLLTNLDAIIKLLA